MAKLQVSAGARATTNDEESTAMAWLEFHCTSKGGLWAALGRALNERTRARWSRTEDATDENDEEGRDDEG